MPQGNGSYLQNLLIILDTGPLGKITNPYLKGDELKCLIWFKHLLSQGVKITTSEICDYEVRRELIRSKKIESLKRLNDFSRTFGCLPVTTDVLLKSAELWAWARETNQATADDKSIDADVIICAQAILLNQYKKSPIIVTTNIRHMERYTPSINWEEATLENCIKKLQKISNC